VAIPDYKPRQGRVWGNGTCLSFTPPPPLRNRVDSFWQLDAGHGRFAYRSIPDNCVDWIINVDRPQDSVIVAPFPSSVVFEFEGPVSYFGIRFRILGQQGLISAPVGEWAVPGADVPARDVVASHIAGAVSDCVNGQTCFDARCRSLVEVFPRVAPVPRIDPRVARFVEHCFQHSSSRIRLSDEQCAGFGASARQIRRLSRLFLGLSPRGFARVLRFQQSIRTLTAAGRRAAWVDHYYDQAHFIREFRRLSGLTPKQLVDSSVLYNTRGG
jgi:AraC-like DNA-binding protein